MLRQLFIAMLLLPAFANAQGLQSNNPVSLLAGAHYNFGHGPGIELGFSHDRVLDRTTKSTGSWRARGVTHSWSVELFLPPENDLSGDPKVWAKYSLWHRKGTYRGHFARQKWGDTDFICFGGSLIFTNEDTQIKAGLRPELGINFPRLGADPNSRLQRHRIKIVYGYTWFPTGEGLEEFGHQISLVYFREANYLR